MRHALRTYIALLAAALLAGGCAPAPAAAVARPTAAPTALPPSPTGAPTAAPSAEPAATLASLAAPSATPAFPTARLSADSLPELRMLRAVGFGGARHAAISPDSRLLAVATGAGVALFELPRLRHLRFDRVAEGALRVAFSPDGASLLVRVGQYGPQRLERRATSDGALIERLPAPDMPFEQAILSPSGAFRAELNPLDSAPAPGVTISRTADGGQVYNDDSTLTASFSPDSGLAALVGYDGTVRLVSTASGAASQIALPGFWSVGFSPDGLDLLAAGRALWRWDVTTGELRQGPARLAVADDPGLLGGRQRIRASADGGLITVEGEYDVFEASTRAGSAWRVGPAGLSPAWDSLAGGAGIGNFGSYVGAISPATNAAAWTDDGETLNLAQGDGPPASVKIAGAISALAFSPDGDRLAVGDREGMLRLLSAADLGEARRIQVGRAVAQIAFSPDGDRLAVGSTDGAVTVWPTGSGEPTAQLAPVAATPSGDGPPRSWPPRFIFSADGSLLIAWDGASVRFYSLRDGQLLRTLDGGAEDVAIGPRQRVVAIVRGGRVELWGTAP